MHNVAVIFKRELSSYFVTPLAYVFIVIFLVLAGVFTFFFGGFQQDNHHSTQNFPLVVPTAEAVARLRSLFPSNPRLDLYLNLLGDLRGTAAPIPVGLGLDPVTRVDRGSVQFATAPLALPATNDGPQWLIRFDHHRSDAHRFSLRFVYDSRVDTPRSVSFPGFLDEQAAQNLIRALPRRCGTLTAIRAWPRACWVCRARR